VPHSVTQDPRRLTQASSSAPAPSSHPPYASFFARVSASTWDIRAECTVLLHKPFGSSSGWSVASLSSPTSTCTFSAHSAPESAAAACLPLPSLATRSVLLSTSPPSPQSLPVKYAVEIAHFQKREFSFSVREAAASAPSRVPSRVLLLSCLDGCCRFVA
jgi:hypothetical protein